MITPAQISAALGAKIGAVFPGEPLYENLAPRDFIRPSNLLELQGIAMDGNWSCGAVEFRFTYKLTTFVAVDEVHNSHFPALDARAMLVLGAFAEGYLKVGGRAPRVTRCQSGNSMNDCAEVIVELTLAMNRAEFSPAELLPIMQTLDLQTIPKEDRNI
ncbi:MAG: hypothetical protein RRY97_10070 [Oscillibacter sp.]